MSKQRIPRQKRGQDTKQKILDSGIAMFAGKGYFQTNSNEIARNAGLSTGSFYMYYKDKKPLMMDIIESFYAELSSHLDEFSKMFQKSDANLIDYIVDILTGIHKKYSGVQKVILSLYYSDMEFFEHIEGQRRMIQSTIAKNHPDFPEIRIKTIFILLETMMAETVVKKSMDITMELKMACKLYLAAAERSE